MSHSLYRKFLHIIILYLCKDIRLIILHRNLPVLFQTILLFYQSSNSTSLTTSYASSNASNASVRVSALSTSPASSYSSSIFTRESFTCWIDVIRPFNCSSFVDVEFIFTILLTLYLPHSCLFILLLIHFSSVLILILYTHLMPFFPAPG